MSTDSDITEEQAEVLEHLRQDPTEWKMPGGDGYKVALLTLVGRDMAEVRYSNADGLECRIKSKPIDQGAHLRDTLLRILKEEDGGWVEISERMLSTAEKMEAAGLVEYRGSSDGYEARLAP